MLENLLENQAVWCVGTCMRSQPLVASCETLWLTEEGVATWVGASSGYLKQELLCREYWSAFSRAAGSTGRAWKAENWRDAPTPFFPPQPHLLLQAGLRNSSVLQVFNYRHRTHIFSTCFASSSSSSVPSDTSHFFPPKSNLQKYIRDGSHTHTRTPSCLLSDGTRVSDSVYHPWLVASSCK